MAKAYLLSEDDRRAIAALLVAERGRGRGGGGSSQRDFDDLPAPDVYVVRTPVGGIDALYILTGTGTGVGGDTGTAYDEQYSPGSADCDVYRLEATSSTVEELVYQGFSILVYNLMEIDVAGEVFVTAHRDKYGTWYIPNPGLPFTTC